MSSYEYTDSIGDKLRISSNGYGGATLVAEGKTALPRKTILVEREDVPVVAAELLKAAGIEATILPKTTEEVRVANKDWLVCGEDEGYAADLLNTAPELIRQRAANCIALAEYIESTVAREAAEKAEAEAADKKLKERRDALAKELTNLNYAYDDFSAGSYLLKAIDRIIELEDGASRD